MGEAKRRGTFEQRKAMAIERDKKILKEQEAKAKPIVAEQDPTPEEVLKRVQLLSLIQSSMPYVLFKPYDIKAR